jgi:hypothetical protein
MGSSLSIPIAFDKRKYLDISLHLVDSDRFHFIFQTIESLEQIVEIT